MFYSIDNIHAPRATRHAPRATRHAPRATRHAPRATRHAPRSIRNDGLPRVNNHRWHVPYVRRG